jgi:IrrE N-terminal-like domain
MATQQFLNWVEARGEQLRAKCQLAPFARLNPFSLADKMEVLVIKPVDVPGISQDVLDQILIADPDAWDAGTVTVGEGKHIVVMNPSRVRERQNASLMEELAHIHLGHKPSRLHIIGHIVLREWKQSHETEAYWVGAAALVPRRVVKGAITRRITVPALASQCDVSCQLIEFREKLLGLRLLREAVAV